MHREYQSLRSLVLRIDEPNGTICRRILHDHYRLFVSVPGSSHNHQVWEGGYHDHISEVMNIATVLYEATHALRSLPFSLSDALLVLFLHDIEKPWRFELVDGELRTIPALDSKESRKTFREQKLRDYGIVLTEAQLNALTYVEGEYKDYSHERRVSNELAAFCHCCDTWSARIWHDRPVEENDSWLGAKRINA